MTHGFALEASQEHLVGVVESNPLQGVEVGNLRQYNSSFSSSGFLEQSEKLRLSSEVSFNSITHSVSIRKRMEISKLMEVVSGSFASEHTKKKCSRNNRKWFLCSHGKLSRDILDT